MRHSYIAHLSVATLAVLGSLFAFYSFGVRASSSTLTVDDYLQIQQLYANFNHALDTAQPDRYAALWTDDGEFTGGRGPGRANEVRTPIKGKDDLRKMAVNAGHGSRHFVANLVITPTADGAKASCYLLLMNALPSPPTVVETAIYDDTLVKTAQGWKFKKRINWRDDDDISPWKPTPYPQGMTVPPKP